MVNEIILERKTYILISDTLQGTRIGLYPREDLYPSDDPNNMIYPSGVISVSNSIVEGSMSLDEMIVDSDIDLGKLYSNKFECDLYNVDSTLQGKFIQVFQTSNEYEDIIPIFLGYIDSCTSNRLGIDWHLIAYDLAYYYGGIDISDKWNTYMSTTSVITTIYGNFPLINIMPVAPQQPYCKINWCGFLKLILDDLDIVHDFDFTLELNVSCDYRFANDFNLRVNNTVQKMTLADLISSICQLAKVSPHFDKDGVFRVIELDTSASALENAIDLTENYEKENLNITQLIHPPFDNVEYKYTQYDGNNVTTTTATFNSNTNKYSITNNILLLIAGCLKGRLRAGAIYQWYSNTALIGRICTYLQSLEYYVGSIALIVSDVSNILGELVKVDIDDLDGNYKETLYFPVLKSTYSGTQLINQTVEASGTIPSVSDTQQIDYSGENTQTQVENTQTQVNEVDTRITTVENNLGILHWESVADNKSVGNSSLTKVGEFTLDAGTYVLDLVGAFSASTSSSGYRRMYIASSTSTSPLGYICQDQRSPIGSSSIETVLRISCTIVPTATTTYHVYMAQTNGNSSSLTANVRLQTLRIK